MYISSQTADSLWRNSMESGIEKAKEKHRSGYNCSQAIACAYCDLVGMEEPLMHQMMEGLALAWVVWREPAGHYPARQSLPA